MADVNYHALSDTTANLNTVKAPGLIAIDTTKGHAVLYEEDGTTLRHILTADSSNNVINTLGNVLFNVTKYLGLSASTARISFPDTATVQVDDADLVVDAGGVYADSAVIDTTTLVVNKSGYEDKVGIGTATPATTLEVAGIITGTNYGKIGDQNNNVSDAPIHLINKWIGNSLDPEQVSIALCKTDITAADFTGFNGRIDFYRGNAVAGGIVGSIEISIVNAYEQLYCTKFIAGQGPGTWSLIKGTVAGVEYVILKSSSLSKVDVFVNGTARGIEPTMVRYADISSISTWAYPHIAIDSSNNVGINTNTPGCALCVNGGVSIGDDAATADNNLHVVGAVDIGGTLSVTGNTCLTASTLYLGATTTTANKWRIYDDGTNLLFQRYESSSWVTKVTMAA